MVGQEQRLEMDSLKIAISFLLLLCKEDLETFDQHGLPERTLLEYEMTGLDLAVKSAVGVGLLSRESASGEPVLRPGPKWSEIQDALCGHDQFRT